MGPGMSQGVTRLAPYMALAAIVISTNDHYNINPPGTDRFKVKNMFHHSKTHWCIVEQVKNPTRIKIYSWWNTVIRSHFMHLSMESTILPPGTQTFNIKRVFSF